MCIGGSRTLKYGMQLSSPADKTPGPSNTATEKLLKPFEQGLLSKASRKSKEIFETFLIRFRFFWGGGQFSADHGNSVGRLHTERRYSIVKFVSSQFSAFFARPSHQIRRCWQVRGSFNSICLIHNFKHQSDGIISCQTQIMWVVCVFFLCVCFFLCAMIRGNMYFFCVHFCSQSSFPAGKEFQLQGKLFIFFPP